MSFLEDILKTKKDEIKDLKALEKKFLSEIKEGESKKFYQAITKDPINVIAEIKKASPTMGILRKDLNILKLAKTYEENNANAISVLTDQKYFLGNINSLEEVKKTVKIPVLRKDFIINRLQVLEARYYGADAILLIAGILPIKTLKNLISFTRDLGMDFILEVHDEEDLKKALKTDSEILGINNRNLRTFQVSLNNSLRLLKNIPEDRKIVIESGISGLKDIQLFTELNVNTFLIGRYLIEQGDPGSLLLAIKNAGAKSFEN